jgi:hypothetical protein
MSDIMQEVFDNAEELSLALHYIAGCEDALVAILDEPMARAPDKGRAVYALLASIACFRAQAAALSDRMARSVAG